MKLTNVQDLVLAVTYRCNSRCRMCNIWQIEKHENEINPLDIENLPKTLKDINISGGEPFLRSDLPEFIAAISRYLPEAKITISSNGFATDLIRSQLRKILRINPDVNLVFSVDGVGDKHDDIRNIPSGFNKLISSIETSKELGVKNIRLGFTMGDYNTSELRGVYQLAKKLKMEMTLAVVHSSDNFFNAHNPREKTEQMTTELGWLIEEELKSWNPKRWARAYFAYGMKYYLETGQRLLPDYSGDKNAFVDPQGNVYPCDVSTQNLGNIKERNLENILNDAKVEDCDSSWMICTARPAIKRHVLSVLFWIFINKVRCLLKRF